MIIDFHTHLFPPQFSGNRTSFFEGEPAFEAIYHSPQSKVIGVEELITSMDKEGVDKSVVFGFPWEKAENFRRHNDYIIESVEKYPDRLIGFCCFSPLSSTGPEEVNRCINSGISGVGELAVYASGLNAEVIEGLKEVMTICSNFDLPLLLHTNESVGHQYSGKAPMTLREIYMMIKTYPANRIVLAHWGGGLFFYALMKKEVREVLKNVWFDTAASPFLYTPEIYRVAGEIIGFDKILFGTDYPLIRPERYLKEMALAGLSPQNIDKVKGLNAARLLRLTN